MIALEALMHHEFECPKCFVLLTIPLKVLQSAICLDDLYFVNFS